MQMTKHRPRHSIILKIVLLMTLVAFLQALFIAALIRYTKVPETLKENAYGLFAEKVQNRKNYLTIEMTNRWSNISNFKALGTDLYNNILGGQSRLNKQQTERFLDESTSVLLRMMQTSMSTGAFIILDDAGDASLSNSGLYIQNYNPLLGTRAAERENLVMLRGPNDISKKHTIPLSNAWTYGISLDAAHADIMKKPMFAATITDRDQYQGYWHVSPSLNNPENRVITYSLPMRDQNGRVFGVIGVEIAQDYLYKLLPFDEFAETESYGYLLAQVLPDTGEIVPLITQGTVQRSIATLDVPLQLQMENDPYACYSTDTSIGRISMHSAEISPYGHNTPFSDTQWLLIGLTAQSNITGFADHLNHTLLLMTFWSIVFGVLASLYIGYRFALPIMKLSQAVKRSQLDGVVRLERTSIAEIDDLSEAIEQLSQNILDNTLMTDKIMEMARIDVGSFAYKKGATQVSLSSSLLRMLGMDRSEQLHSALPCEQFFALFDALKQQPDSELSSTYLVSDAPKRWFKIMEIDSEETLLGVVLDVTRDALEWHALNYQRDYDMLTGIYNRSAFHRKAQQIFSTAELSVAAVAMFDLDNLKYVNDAHGHETGDLYIKTAAQMMEQTLGANSVVGRMAGDEFYVFFYGFTTRDEILNLLAELYLGLDREPIILPDGTSFKVRMSGGLAWYDTDSRDYNELIRYADFAMYEGKHTVKGELRQFKREVYLAESFMLSGKEELNRVLDNQFIDFAFQPILDAKSGALFAYEALMRPQSDLLNSPTKLIQIATAQSQLWKIEKITFFKALAQYSKYHSMFGDAKLFINSVPNQILKDAEYEEFEQLYAEHLSSIVVEVIENERLDPDIFRIKQARFATWGAKIALDDYGSGYNNDLSLLNIHPHIVKLDRFLISGVDSDSSHQAIVSKIISFCKESNILILAEGIETETQLRYLLRAGVDYLQGYYIGMPMAIPNFDPTDCKAEIKAIYEEQAAGIS